MSVTHSETLWKISKKSTPPEQVFTTTKSVENGDDLTLLQIPHYAGLQPEQPYVVECIHVANNGLKSDPGTIDFTPVGSSIQAPIISYPLNNTTLKIGNDLIIQTSPFVSTPAGLAHSFTDWRISATNSPESAPLNESSTNLTSYTVNKSFFQEGKTYYLFVRYKSGETYSGWSAGIKISTSTVSISVQKPSITSPTSTSTINGTIDNTLTSSVFIASDGVTHTSTIWQISKNTMFDSFVLNQTSQTNKTSFTIPANTLADNNAVYYIRAKHIGSTGESEFSDVIYVTNDNTSNAAINTPTILTPSMGAVLTLSNILITSSPYQPVVAGAATHTTSLWQLSEFADFNTITWQSDSVINKVSVAVPSSAVTPGKLYYVRVKYKSGAYSSAYSNVISFQTSYQPTVSTVFVISPANEYSLAVSNPLNIVGSDFAGIGGATFDSATFQIAADSQFTDIVWSTVKNSPAATSANVPANTLSAYMTLYVRVGYYSSVGNTITWSNFIVIQTTMGTQNAVVNTPVITAPTYGATVKSTMDLPVTTSPFSEIGGLQMTSVQIQIASDSSFLNLVYNKEESSNGNTIFYVLSGPLNANQMYYLRCRHYGTKTNSAPIASAWSGAIMIRTAPKLNIQTPTIITPSGDYIYQYTVEATPFVGDTPLVVLYSQWQISTDAVFTDTDTFLIGQTNGSQQQYIVSTNTAGVVMNSTRYIRMRYVGRILPDATPEAYSDWSGAISFRITDGTALAFLAKPSILSPTTLTVHNVNVYGDGPNISVIVSPPQLTGSIGESILVNSIRILHVGGLNEYHEKVNTNSSNVNILHYGANTTDDIWPVGTYQLFARWMSKNPISESIGIVSAWSDPIDITVMNKLD